MIIETDILIIGSGIAGLTAAIFGARAGFRVILVTRGAGLDDSATKYAQGGIIYRCKNDSAEILSSDIWLASDKIGNKENIRILSKEGPELVKSFLIDELKVPFSKGAGRALHFTKEAAHSRKRIIHIADATGKFIEDYLIKEVKKYPNIKILTSNTAIDLITPSHHSPERCLVYEPPQVIGSYIFDSSSRRVKTILSQRTILATGGLGRLFLYTTNPKGARGDGVAMASRAGARIINMEYIQFHPTCFYHREGERFLISESVRGEGGKLLNKFKKPFMKKYSPLGDLAPRDEVSRAIYQEMLETESDCIFLDLTPSKKKGVKVKERFPSIYKQCFNYGIDIEKDLIPVVPAAHYSCGGVWTDKWGRTNLQNLYAVGEVACTGVHGANRLASTSLLEGLLWAKKAVEDIKKNRLASGPANPVRDNISDRRGWWTKFKIPNWRDTGTQEPDDALLLQDWTNIRTTMWNYVGLVRTAKRLERAEKDLTYLENRIESFYRETKLTDNLIGLRNGVKVARLIASSARMNKQSAGCHYRID